MNDERLKKLRAAAEHERAQADIVAADYEAMAEKNGPLLKALQGKMNEAARLRDEHEERARIAEKTAALAINTADPDPFAGPVGSVGAAANDASVRVN